MNNKHLFLVILALLLISGCAEKVHPYPTCEGNQECQPWGTCIDCCAENYFNDYWDCTDVCSEHYKLNPTEPSADGRPPECWIG